VTTIRLEFPAGRYHATPHGRHVNEGVTEWPPSPYRLLRALYDVWLRKCPSLPPAQVESALGALAAAPPRFHLARATATHTRSYLNANGLDPAEKNLVFDGFLRLEDDARCYLIWPHLKLTAEQEQVLQALLENLNYLGRSESWIRACVTDESKPEGIVCEPLDSADAEDGEVIPVACAVAPSSYSGKRSWLDALTTSTLELAKAKTSTPPLLRTLRYLRPTSCLETNPVRTRPPSQPRVSAVLLSLEGSVLPLETSALDVAEQIRTRLMGAHKRENGGDESLVSPLFSGKDTSGNMRRDHGHVYILPLADTYSRIDRVLIYSTGGWWTASELAATYGVRELWQGDGRPAVQCVLTWEGSLNPLPGSPFCFSRAVESATPFIAPRHCHRNQELTRFLDGEIRRECRNHGLPEPPTVQRIDRAGTGFFECVEFRRNRRNDPVRPGYAFRLEFNEPVRVPFSLGYAAHFGLGMFGTPRTNSER
jgi:CRISPR-associated protein Csb2